MFAISPVVVVFGILGPDRQRIALGINPDLGFLQALLGVGMLDRVDFDFIAIPGLDLDRAVDVLQFNSAIRGQRIALMKFLGLRTLPVGGMSL